MIRHAFGAIALLAAATAAHAQSSSLHGFVGLALTGGGKTLATVQYSNGTTQDIKSGGLLHLKGGIELHPAGAPWAVQASVGYHVDDSSASNGSVRFSRIPVELLGFWHATEKLRIGGGLRVATDARLESSGAAASLGDYGLGSNTGLVIEGEYLFTPHIGMTLRAVDEKYTTPGGSKVDGSHIGVGVNYHF